MVYYWYQPSQEMQVSRNATCDYVAPTTGRQCHRARKYVMYLQVHGESMSRLVKLCATCDKNMGRKHLMELGWLLADAIKWEKNPSHVSSNRLGDRPDSPGLASNGSPGSIRSIHNPQLVYAAVERRRGGTLTGVNPRY